MGQSIAEHSPLPAHNKSSQESSLHGPYSLVAVSEIRPVQYVGDVPGPYPQVPPTPPLYPPGVSIFS